MTRNIFRAASLLLAIAIAGCGGADAPNESTAPLGANKPAGPQALPRLGKAPPAPTSLEGLEHTRGPQGSPKALANGGYSIDTTSREQVRLFYKTIYASSAGVASGWAGNAGACNAGDTSADYKAAVLRRVNWFRAMAGVPASVQLDATFNAKAQQAALLMSANSDLNHSPPANWLCTSQLPDGVVAAGKSNLALGTMGPDSITQYMEDPGPNNFEVGHRRWVLYPQTQMMGTGDVGGTLPANALWVQDGNFAAPRPAVRDSFVAWPAKGYVPYNTVYPRWSLSYPNANFTAATVTMKKGNTTITATKETVLDGFGENTMVWFPQGYTDGMQWAKPTADETYTVTISNVLQANPLNGAVPSSFTYTVTVFDPETPGTGDGPITISGGSTLAAGQPGNYSFSAIPGATGYQWRSLAGTAFTLADGAESGSGNFTASTSAGYPLVTSDAHATGAKSFHLAHAQPVDQTLQLNQLLVAGAGATLNFNSRLGLSSSFQHAIVEVSPDQGVSWTTVYEQAGTQDGSTFELGETSFHAKSISLAAFVNRTLTIRWRYALLPTGGYYPQTTAGIGWYIDDISTTGMTAATVGATTDIASPAFTLTSGAGTVLLQARPGMYGYFADWGLTKSVAVLAPNPADCLFDWAEAQLGPGLAAHTTSIDYLGVFYLRVYSSGLVLGLATADLPGYNVVKDNIYYTIGSGGDVVNLGAKAGWYATAGCTP